ncbi:MAG TPA: DUF1566 domain-containing protein [Ideonella sp.]|nr:DUF1566 domain-containing protein [Ideonella sp.]
MKSVIGLLCMTTATMSSAAGYTLNDTAEILCFVDNQYTTECDGTWTDGDFGRDAEHPSDKNGYAGFSFTKLDADGNKLNSGASQWACIKDNITGLIWENKTNNTSIHDGSRTFNQFDNPPSKLADASNAEKLCGYDDWRVPARRELLSIYSIKRGASAHIDERYFQNTIGSFYWTATPYARDARPTNYWLLNFDSMWLTGRRQSTLEEQYARAIRSDKPYGRNQFVAKDAEIEDKGTGLTWKRCSIGQAWDGLTCVGVATDMTISAAIAASKLESLQSGQLWRVPNFKELDSIIDTSKRWKSSIDTMYFPDNFLPGSTWTINGSYGFSFIDGTSGFAGTRSVANVRLVRDTIQD